MCGFVCETKTIMKENEGRSEEEKDEMRKREEDEEGGGWKERGKRRGKLCRKRKVLEE